MVRDLLTGFVSGEWVAELDLSTLERWPASQVGDTLRERHQDRVWMRQVYAPGRSALATRPGAENRSEASMMLRERMQEWNRQLLEEGRVEGRAEGQMELMRRMAARKFGGETAKRLAERLEPVHDVERIVEIGEWLIECDSGEELLARLEGEYPLP